VRAVVLRVKVPRAMLALSKSTGVTPAIPTLAFVGQLLASTHTPTATVFNRVACGGERTAGVLYRPGRGWSAVFERTGPKVNGCVVDCICGGNPDNHNSVSSVSSCIKATPCGGEGQRACCGGELVDAIKSCQGSLTGIPGCTGDCTCGGSANPFQISSSGTWR